jgi:ribonucleoside-diphosphate reductase alpha chain
MVPWSTGAMMIARLPLQRESLNLEKIHRVITWAADGLNNVSVSQVELKSQIQFYDGMAFLRRWKMARRAARYW